MNAFAFNSNQTRSENSRILMILASSQFRDEEYQQPREILEQSGFSITVASNNIAKTTGMLGMVVTPDINLQQVQVTDYSAVIFVGGMGATEYFQNSTAHKIAKDTVSHHKILAAICIAPTILANAGILHGLRATVYPSEVDNLKANGVIYTGTDVEVDAGIVTANGPKAAKEFAAAILKLLK